MRELARRIPVFFVGVKFSREFLAGLGEVQGHHLLWSPSCTETPVLRYASVCQLSASCFSGPFCG